MKSHTNGIAAHTQFMLLDHTSQYSQNPLVQSLFPADPLSFDPDSSMDAGHLVSNTNSNLYMWETRA